MSSRSYGPPFGDDTWEDDGPTAGGEHFTKPAAGPKSARKPSRLDNLWFCTHYRSGRYYSLVATPWSRQTPGQKFTVARRRLTLLAAAYVASFLVFGLFAHGVSSGTRDFYVNDYLRAAGVAERQTMPLELGGTSTQTSSQIDGSGFAFLGFGTADLHGKSSSTVVVRLGVTFRQTHYIMDVPLSKVQFITQPGAKPSGSFTVDNAWIDTMDVQSHCGSLWTYGICHKVSGSPDIARSRYSKQGPGPMLHDHLEMLTLTVTPRQYKDYLNNGQPTSKH